MYDETGLHQAKGDVAILWVQSPRGYPSSRFDFGPMVLDARLDTHGKHHAVFNGLTYNVNVSSQNSGFFGLRKRYIIDSEVAIEQNHAKTRIWLMRGNAGDVFTRYPIEITRTSTVYRCGCWRNYHQRHFAIHR